MARTKQTPKKPYQHKKYKFPMQGLKVIANEMEQVDNCISKVAMAWWVYLDKLCTEVFLSQVQYLMNMFAMVILFCIRTSYFIILFIIN